MASCELVGSCFLCGKPLNNGEGLLNSVDPRLIFGVWGFYTLGFRVYGLILHITWLICDLIVSNQRFSFGSETVVPSVTRQMDPLGKSFTGPSCFVALRYPRT